MNNKDSQGKDNMFFNKDTEKIKRPLAQQMNNYGAPAILSATEEQLKLQLPDMVEMPINEFVLPDITEALTKDRVIIAPIAIMPTEKSGLVDPGGKQIRNGFFINHPYQGIVVAIGPGIGAEKIEDVKVGDLVFLESIPTQWHMYNLFIINGYTYFLTRYSNIIGIASKIHVNNSVDKKIYLTKTYVDFSQ